MTALNTRVDAPLVDIDLAELAAVSAELEQKPASAAIRWAWERFGTGVVLATKGQEMRLTPGADVTTTLTAPLMVRVRIS